MSGHELSVNHSSKSTGLSHNNNDVMKTRKDFEKEYIHKTPLFQIDPSVVGGGFHK